MPFSSEVKRLSIAVLVRDAADALRLTLASIRSVADQIVVLDTGSVDKSREVAREFRAEVYDVPWCDDFSAARNEAAGKVRGDWLLWLDAGETISESEAVELKQFISSEANPACAYLMLVRVAAAKGQSADEQIARLRLIPNHLPWKFTGRVRESCASSLIEAGCRLEGVPYVIRRGEREHDERLKKRRAQRNIRLAELECREVGPAPRLWNCLAEGMQQLGDHRRAVECYQMALASAERGSPQMLEAYYGLLTTPNSGDDESAGLRRCVEAIDVHPLDAQLLCALGGYLHARGQAPLALQAYSTAFRFGQVEPSVWHVADIRDVAAVCYSVGLQLADRKVEAAQFLEEAVRESPESVRIRRRLIETYVEQGDREAALAHVSLLGDGTPHLEALRSAVRGACYAAQRNWIAAKAYLNAAYGHGCRDVLLLKWLGITLTACGESAAARPILEQWAAADPRNPDPARLLAGPVSSAPVAGASPDPRLLRVDPAAIAPVFPLGMAAPIRSSAPAQ